MKSCGFLTVFVLVLSTCHAAENETNSSDVTTEPINGNVTTVTTEGQNDTTVIPPSNVTMSKSQHVKFDDDWTAMFPQCSPAKNKFLSPVNLVTRGAIEVGRHSRTLFLYAFEPIKNYSLQTWYNDTENHITMSALTITLDDKIAFESTYINGLGFEEFKLFRHAVFFMSTSGLGKGQSHHQVNGTTYPMEIMISFTTGKSDNSTVQNTTQVFILVQIQKYDNPNFFPVIEAAKLILKMKSRSDMIKNLTATLEVLSKNLTNMTEAYTKSGKGGEVEKLKPLVPQIERGMRQMKINSKYKVGVEELLNRTTEELDSHGYLKDYLNLTAEYETNKKTYEEVLESLQSNPNDFDLMDQKEILEHLVESNRRRLAGFGSLVGSLMHQVADSKSTILKLDEENNQHKAFMDNITNEIEGEKPENGSTLLTFIKNQIKLKVQIVQLQAKINGTTAELAKTEKALGWRQRMGTFQVRTLASYHVISMSSLVLSFPLNTDGLIVQVTWLMPDRGGIYFYNGSSPLPPCHRIRTSIVLKDPVGISQEQYDTLAKIPAYEGYQQVADKVAPRLAELGPRLLWSNAKNIQWQRDDGVHMKSILRVKYKKELKEHKIHGKGGL